MFQVDLDGEQTSNGTIAAGKPRSFHVLFRAQKKQPETEVSVPASLAGLPSCELTTSTVLAFWMLKPKVFFSIESWQVESWDVLDVYSGASTWRRWQRHASGDTNHTGVAGETNETDRHFHGNCQGSDFYHTFPLKEHRILQELDATAGPLKICPSAQDVSESLTDTGTGSLQAEQETFSSNGSTPRLVRWSWAVQFLRSLWSRSEQLKFMTSILSHHLFQRFFFVFFSGKCWRSLHGQCVQFDRAPALSKLATKTSFFAHRGEGRI